MGFLRPIRMARVGLVGLKDDRERLVGLLHDLGVIEIEPISPEALGEMEPEHGSAQQREVADALLRVRGLLAALPRQPDRPPVRYADVDALLRAARSVGIDEEVGRLQREAEALASERKGLREQIDLLERFRFYEGRLEWLSARRLLAFFGEAPADEVERLRERLPESQGSIVSSADGETVRFLLAAPRESAESVARIAQAGGVTLAAVPERAGTIAEELPIMRARLQAIDERLGAIAESLGAIAKESYARLAVLEEGLAIESRKLEVWNRFGASARAFALEGWIPERERERLERAVEATSGGRAAVYDLATTEEPPTMMENPRGVRFYEFFIRFYSIPQASEWDPTWIFAIAFPIFFGLMLGDVGYGLVILGFSLWMLAGFPGRRRLPSSIKNFVKLIMPPSAMRQLAWTLLPASAIAIALGFTFNAFFGFRFLPGAPLLDPTSKAGLPFLLLLAGYMGVTMVVVGFLLGALKAYFRHHYRAALGKVGGIAYAIGIAAVGLALLRNQPILPTAGPVLAVAWALLALGVVLLVQEGFEGVMGLLEVVSHILSYTRLVGILLASVILAFVIDQVSVGLLHSGLLLALIGVVILVGGQIFNLILGVFEPGIQGARLIFVEQFSKFYSGNGRAFRPLRSTRRLTAPPAAPPPAPSP